MTEKQFWMKLDQITHRKDADQAMKMAGEVILQAYDEGLDFLVACVRNAEDPGLVQQLCLLKDPDHPNRKGGRFLICYTDKRALARARPSDWDKISVRGVVDNMLSNPAIGGLIFNPNDKTSFMCPKYLCIRDQEARMKAMLQLTAEFLRSAEAKGLVDSIRKKLSEDE